MELGYSPHTTQQEGDQLRIEKEDWAIDRLRGDPNYPTEARQDEENPVPDLMGPIPDDLEGARHAKRERGSLRRLFEKAYKRR